jgi:hypothetical protein
MKNIPFYAILFFVFLACNERFDTSQWKEDVAIFRPNKITEEDFELFVRADVKEYVQNRFLIDYGKQKKPVGFVYTLTLTDSVTDNRDKEIITALLNIEDKEGYYDHYEARGDTLCYFARVRLLRGAETVAKIHISKSEVAKEIARQNDLMDKQSD